MICSEPNFAEGGITVRTEYPDRPTYVNANQERVLQVVDNVLNNAAKYADEKSETVLSIFVDYSEVGVALAGSGPGIEQNEFGAVFESFYCSKSARISRVSGSGIGLSIAQGFIEA